MGNLVTRHWGTAPPAEAEAEAPLRWHAVEHRDGGRVRPLGRVTGVFPHHSALRPFLSRLLLDGGSGGELVLVDEATGRIAARRTVGPARASPGG
jgi:hypothetical protein